MPLVTVRWPGYRNEIHESTPAELLAIAAEDPAFIYPYNFLAAIFDQEERPGGISMTTLLDMDKCRRCAILERYEDYTADLEKLWKMARGTMYHKTAEEYKLPGDIAEVRFWATLPSGGAIHGKPDLIRRDALIDYKTTDSPPRWDDPWPDHVKQTQGYRWLVNHAHQWESPLGKFIPSQWECKRLVIWYVDLVEPRGIPVKPLEIRRTVEKPTKKGAANPYKKVKEPDVWDDEKVLAFLEPAYERAAQAFAEYEETGILPPYPKGFNYMTDWTHRFKPTAELCIERWFEEQRLRAA